MSVLSQRTAETRGLASKRGARRHDQILDCALAEFSARGYHRTSIADICARARIARGTLYQYFRDKEGVLAALCERIVERLLARIASWPRFQPPPAGQQSAAVDPIALRLRSLLDVLLEDEAAARLLLRVSDASDGVVASCLRRVEAALLEATTADLHSALAAGRIRRCDPDLVARFLIGGVEALVLSRLDGNGPLELEHVVRETTALVELGLHRQVPRPPGRGPVA